VDKTLTLRLLQKQAEALKAVAQAVRTAIAAHIEQRRQDKDFQRHLRVSLERNQRILERLANR